MKKNYLLLLLLFIFTLAQGQGCADPGQNPGDLGCTTFIYKGIETTYTTVRALDGNIWLQQNLGSTNVAASATDATGFGDLFQWGRWDDGHQDRNSTTSAISLTPNNPIGLNGGIPGFLTNAADWWNPGIISDKWEAQTPSGVTADNGCDPCKALGNNWSMPTQDNWSKILEKEVITNIATAYGSHLKLTVAGNRNDSGGFNFSGQRGYYWSKTSSVNNFSKYLYYSNAVVNAGAGGFREQGSSVRCLKVIPPVTYCNVSVDYDVEPISLVNFADINNQSSEIVNSTAPYEDFTSLTANVIKGNTYTLTVKGNTAGEFEHDIRVFFDWNKDGVFDMDTEYHALSLLPSTGNDAVNASVEIEIPATAIIGATRMRIIKDQWNVYEEGEFDACLNAYYGQVEDYTLNIQENLNIAHLFKDAFRIYPNPTEGVIIIETDFEIKIIKIYNQLGLLVSTQKETQIDLSNVSSGIYMIQVTAENGQAFTQRIIKK